MSGVVIKINDDDDEETDEDDDDVAELLNAAREDLQEDEDDDYDETGQRSNLTKGASSSAATTSGGFSGGNGSSSKKLAKGRQRQYGATAKASSPVFRPGAVAQFLNTLTLCCIFFGMGLTKSLVDMQLEDAAGPKQTWPTQKEMASSIGYIVGFILGGAVLAKFSRSFIMLLTMMFLGIDLLILPWITSDWAVDSAYIFIGLCLAILMTGGNVISLDFWGRRSGPYIHSLHFCLSLGLLIGPLLVDPLSQTRVPALVQKALPKPLTSSIQTTMATPVNSSLIEHPLAVPSALNLKDRPFPQERLLRLWRSKRSSNDPDVTDDNLSSSTAATPQTKDPLLVKIFSYSDKELETLQQQQQDLQPTTTWDVTTTSTSTRTRSPKPKPVFSDGRKLGNDKILDMGEEGLKETTTTIATTTSTSDLSSVVQEQLQSLKHDILENEQIISWLKNDSAGAELLPPLTAAEVLQLANEDKGTDGGQTRFKRQTLSKGDKPSGGDALPKSAAAGENRAQQADSFQRPNNRRPSLVQEGPVQQAQPQFRQQPMMPPSRALGTNLPYWPDEGDVLMMSQPRLPAKVNNGPPRFDWNPYPAPLASYDDVPVDPPYAVVGGAGNMNLDYDLSGMEKPRPSAPPKEVESAIETLEEYLANNSNKEANIRPRRPFPETSGAAAAASAAAAAGSVSKADSSPRATDPVRSSMDGTDPSDQQRPYDDLRRSSSSTSPPPTTTSDNSKALGVQPTSATATKESPLSTSTHRKKPTTSYDNDTEDSSAAAAAGEEAMTISTILTGYGVSRSHVGFVLDASYVFLVFAFQLVCMCYRPRPVEPIRARQQTGGPPPGTCCGRGAEVRNLGGVGSVLEAENRTFKATCTALLFFFNLLHWAAFVALRSILFLLAAGATTTTTSSYSASMMPRVDQAFMATFTAGRFLAIVAASGCMSPAASIFWSLAVLFAGSTGLVVAQEVLRSLPSAGMLAAWVSAMLQAVGLSALLPHSIVWGEMHMSMSSQVVAFICGGLALGELLASRPFLTAGLAGSSPGGSVAVGVGKEVEWLSVLVLGAVILSSVVFLCAYLMARRHGSRCGRPQASGYELASQDDFHRELLDDDEDLDDFESSGPAPLTSLRLTGRYEAEAT